MRGKLIAIEAGTDASGKETQTDILIKRLLDAGIHAVKVSFPNYASKSSWPAKMYLKGEFGNNPESINAYAASVLFAFDRFVTYKKEFESIIEAGGLVIADRYTTSNMVYQASKLAGRDEKIEYIEWLGDLEYSKMGIPKPDIVIYLDMSTEKSFKLMKDRPNKMDGGEKKDIHEADNDYLIKSYENSKFVADYMGWEKVDCINEDGDLRCREDISEDIWKIVNKLISSKD